MNEIIGQVNKERIAMGLEERYIDHRFIHLIDEEKFKIRWPNEKGAYDQRDQCIYISNPTHARKALLLILGSHESGHAGSHNKMEKNGNNYDLDRIGLEEMHKHNPHFRAINEAITHTQALQRSEELFIASPIYSDELAEATKINNEQSYDDNRLSSKSKKEQIDQEIFKGTDNIRALATIDNQIHNAFYAHRYEQRTMNKMTGLLAQYSGESKDDIYNMFVDVATIDKSLPIINLMERSFGPGAFQKLGKKSISPKKFARFVRIMPIMKKIEDIKKSARGTLNKLFGGFRKKKLV